MENILTPVSFVIFGITGDLARRKLIPALWKLFISGNLPDDFSIIGFTRKKWSDKDLKKCVEDILKRENVKTDAKNKDRFIKSISCFSGDFREEKSYKYLSDKLLETDKKIGKCCLKIFHLAVPPEIYEVIFEQIHKSGLSDMSSGEDGRTRVLVEKPFGNNRREAEKLDQKLKALFKEEQIFRVDHYMGKESMQNIIAFRFSNSSLEHLWNGSFIEKINIRLWESLGAEGRGPFYDKVGALRDVGQNHILQMLAFVAMEDPCVFEAEAIRRSRAKVLSELHPISKKELVKFVRRGQCEDFLKEPSVSPASKTETYFRVEARVENKRWKGVPFFLEGGKYLGKSGVEIEVVFRKKNSFICPPGKESILKNAILFRIQPNGGGTPDAYERVILDCIAGDQTFFTSAEEALASWKFITPIIENWKDIPLEKYARGWIPKK